MRNLLSTLARDVILVDATGRRQLLESAKVPLPEVARLGQTKTTTGTAQRPVPTVRLAEIGSTRTTDWNIALADQIAGDQDETGDGMVLIDRDLLGLVLPSLRKYVFAPGRVRPLRKTDDKSTSTTVTGLFQLAWTNSD